MNSKLGIIASMFAMVAMCVFTSCEDDVDEVEVQVVNDCPGLGLNIGETCYTGVGNILGVVNDSCFCEVSDTIGDGIFDCPVWELNIGDSCADGTDIDGNFLVEGILDANCNCIEEFDCPGLMGNIGDPCQGGWGIITADCDCVDDSMWDCPDIQMNIGDSCFVAGVPYGVVTIDCECYSPQEYTIEGRWLWSPGPTIEGANTMYEFINGVRYTYYCDTAECGEAYWNSLETPDAIPGTNDYTFEDGVLTVDLNFGNELVTPLTFECDGDQVNFVTPGFSLWRIGSDCE